MGFLLRKREKIQQRLAAVVGRPEGAKGDWFRLVEDGPEYNTRKRRLLMLGRDLFYAGRGLGPTEALDQSRFALVAALAARDSA